MEEIIKLTEEAISKAKWSANYHQDRAAEAVNTICILEMELSQLREKFAIANPQEANLEELPY